VRPRATKLATLKGCLLLPLSADEKALLRDIIFEYERSSEVTWATANNDRFEEVQALFAKCERILRSHVPQPAV
jgi:hypothetical protein